MKTFYIFGASDDLVECSGLVGCDEFNVHGSIAYHGYISLTSSTGSLKIHIIYDGSWAFAICPQDGDYDKFPDWNIIRSFGHDVRYSETIRIEVPDDTIFKAFLK